MYSFLCALEQRCLDEISICRSGNWTFLEHHYFCLTEIDLLSRPRSERICADDLGAAVGLPWLVTDHHQDFF